MKVRLTPHQEKFIARKMEGGGYLSPAEIIREALRVYELVEQEGNHAILRHGHKPADTCGQLLERFENYVPPVDVADMDKFIKSRGRCSRRK